jgi:UDP-N-acetylglucosamine acyltransferase
MAEIHPSAIISSHARIGTGVRVGPFCIVGDGVELGDGVVLEGHVVVEGRTRIGARTHVFPFASIGHPPQDMKYAGEPSELVIGEDNTIREHVTMNPGTQGGGMVTRIGSRCLFMMGAHVAHDCMIGDRVVMANNATLAGHVVVEEDAIVGGLAAVHQFVRIGRLAMIGGMSGVEHDVIPYALASGNRACLQGLNLVGLKRQGLLRDDIQALKALYDSIFNGEDTLTKRMDELDERFSAAGPARDVIAFLRGDSSRALCRPRPGNGR